MATTLSEFDLYLFAQGTHNRAYDKLGAHLVEQDGHRGVHFAVWAPNARDISVIGDFNGWDPTRHPMRSSSAGVWDAFIAGLPADTIYKYRIVSNFGGYVVDKADPYGFAAEIRPHTASRVWDLNT
jgi:1,4-alpha-glucan branching enzyme